MGERRRQGRAGTADGITGRADELRQLRLAIGAPDCRLVILRGPAGAGKSALAEAALARARADGALAGSGKYAEGDAHSPYAPILQALSGAVAQALDQFYEPAPVQSALAMALGPAAEVLRRAGFRGLAGAPSMAIAASGRREGVALLTDAVLQLARWLEDFGLPIVLLIDDWRRNAPESRSLLESLSDECAGLTLLLTERDDQPPHELAGGPGARVLEVAGLRPPDRRALFIQLLGEAGAAAYDYLGPDAPGLPFDLLMAAQALADSGALHQTGGRWRVDPVRAAAALPQGLGARGARRIRGLTKVPRRVALAIAVWGDGVAVRWLGVGLDMTPSALNSALSRLEAIGLIQRQAEEARFAHDRLREAVLSESGAEAESLAGEIADRLAAKAGTDWAEVAYAALHLRQAGGLDGARAAVWRDRFAEGALAARARLDAAAATSFAESAWRLGLGAPADDPAKHRLILREAVRAAADRRDASETLARVEALAALPVSDAERGEDNELAIFALQSSGEPELAWRAARAAMARHGVKLPDKVGLPQLIAASWTWRGLRRRTAPTEVGPAIGGLTRTAHAAGIVAFDRNPALAIYITCRSAARVRRHRRAAAFWTSVDALLCAVFGDLAGAAELGREAEARVSEDAVFRASTLYRALYFGQIWARPLAELRARCGEIHDLALLEGDLGTAAIATRNRALIGWRVEGSLTALRRELEDLLREARRLGDANIATDVAAFLGAVEILRRPADPSGVHGIDAPPLKGSPLLRLEVASFQSDWARSVELGLRLRRVRRGFDSHPGGAVWRFHENLARLKTGRRARRSDMAFIRRAAALNPADHRHKLLMIEAEQLRLSGQLAESLETYAQVVDLALASDSRLEAGLACEGAANVAREARQADLAEAYGAQAHAVWLAWGATARTGIISDGSLESRLAAAQSEALAAERDGRAKSRFLADVAHELRTPLQAMQGLIDLAAQDRDAIDLAAFRDIFGNLRTVVDDLTDFGALASGEARLVLGPVAVADLLASEARLIAAPGGGGVQLSVADDLPPVIHTDGARVRQVLRNLLSNAVKYGEGGAVSIRAAVADEGERLVIAVEDDGPGFSELALRRVFEPFERGAHAGDGRGLGLGLALSRRLAEQLGGSLNAENRSEGGARFLLHLPAKAAAMAEPPKLAPLPLAILLAEDMPLVRQVIAANLRQAGHEVREVGDGAAALRTWRSRAFDAAIVDWSMPILGGRSLLERLCAARAGVPVIVLTASSDPQIAGEAEAAGAAQVLRKPVSAAELSQALAQGRRADPLAAPLVDEMAALRGAAKLELARRGGEVVAMWRAGRPLEASEVHRLAGLAAQFGWSAVAAAADVLEVGLRTSPAEIGAAAEAFERTLAELPALP